MFVKSSFEIHKTALIVAATLSSLTLAAEAQQRTVESIFLSKDRYFKQTSPTNRTLLPASEFPYGFTAEVNGVSRAAAVRLKPTITLPQNSRFRAIYNVNPALGLDGPFDQSWNFGYTGSPFPSEFDDWGTRTKSELDRAFPNGNYVFRTQGRTIVLRLPGDAYPPAPVVRLSGGKWFGGQYYINPKLPLTIDTGTYANYGKNLNNYIFLEMEDDTTGNDLFDHVQVAKPIPNGPPRSLAKSYTRRIPANTLRAGRTYYVYSGFGAVVSRSVAIPGTPSLASYSTESEVEIIARPAPAR